MALYSTLCSKCNGRFAVRLSFAAYDSLQAGLSTLTCGACGGMMNVVLSPGTLSVVFHDGESGGWASKSLAENKYRAKRRKVMEQRQRDHAPRTRLNPNFGGELTHDWKDARDMAFETVLEEARQEFRPEEAIKVAADAAATYDPLVKKEV